MDNNKPVLLPCPFCGSTENHELIHDGFGDNYARLCGNCGARTSLRSTPEVAIFAWNARPSPWVPIAEIPKSDSKVKYWLTLIGGQVLRDARYYHRWEAPMGYPISNVIAYRLMEPTPDPYTPDADPEGEGEILDTMEDE